MHDKISPDSKRTVFFFHILQNYSFFRISKILLLSFGADLVQSPRLYFVIYNTLKIVLGFIYIN